MPWRLRLSGPDLYHHIYAWGNDRNSIFTEEAHYDHYLQLLKKYSQLFSVDVIAYALMEWHVHLFVHDHDDNVSQFIERLHGDYAPYFNKESDRVGHVFGERFNNKIVQPNDYALRLSKYIHRQAVAAKLVKHPLEYPWTSYRVYCGLEKSTFVKPEIILDQLSNDEEKYRQYASLVMSEAEDPVDWERARLYIVGDDDFKKFITRNYKRSKGRRKPSAVDPIQWVCDKLNMTKKMLMNPCGRKERMLRRRAIVILNEIQGINQTQIARILKVSRLTVINAIKEKGELE